MELQKRIATVLEKENYILRSGRAIGSDIAFESGVTEIKNKKIYIAWETENDRYGENGVVKIDNEILKKCDLYVNKIHGNPLALKQGARKLQQRNICQVLGEDLISPSEFVIFYAIPYTNGRVKGGTNTAVMLAKSKNIPTYNLYDYKVFEYFIKFVERLEQKYKIC